MSIFSITHLLNTKIPPPPRTLYKSKQALCFAALKGHFFEENHHGKTL